MEPVYYPVYSKIHDELWRHLSSLTHSLIWHGAPSGLLNSFDDNTRNLIEDSITDYSNQLCKNEK